MVDKREIHGELKKFFDARVSYPDWQFYDLGGIFSQYFVLSECLSLSRDARILTVGDYSCRDVLALKFLGYHPQSADLSPPPNLDPSRDVFIQLDLNDAAMIAQRLPGKYDLIILGNVLEHIANDALALRALAGQLKEGGTILLDVPLINPFAWFPQDRPEYHIRVYTPRILRRIFAVCGLKEERFIHRGVLLNWWYTLPCRGAVWLSRRCLGERRTFQLLTSLAGFLMRRGERSFWFKALCPWSWSYGALAVLRHSTGPMDLSSINREHFFEKDGRERWARHRRIV